MKYKKSFLRIINSSILLLIISDSYFSLDSVGKKVNLKDINSTEINSFEFNNKKKIFNHYSGLDNVKGKKTKNFENKSTLIESFKKQYNTEDDLDGNNNTLSTSNKSNNQSKYLNLDYTEKSMKEIFNNGLPIIKKILNPNFNLKHITNDSQLYQGSLIFQMPENNNQRLSLNVINNFIYNNSSVIQVIEGSQSCNSSVKSQSIKKDDSSIEKTIKSIEKVYKAQINKLKKEYDEKIKNLNENLSEDDKKINEFNKYIKTLQEEDREKFINLKKEYESKIDNLKKDNGNEIKTIDEKNKEIKTLKNILNEKISQFEKQLMEQKNAYTNDKKILEQKLKLQNEKNLNETIQKNNTKMSQVTTVMKKENDSLHASTKKTKIETLPKSSEQKVEVIDIKQEENLQSINRPNLYMPVKVIDDFSNNKNDIKIIPNEAVNILKKLENIEPLYCMDVNSDDYKHFQMNYEKCKELNDIYLKFARFLHSYFQVKFNLLLI